jgi:RNA polymerase sigma-70 factor, ECF subfamily
MSLKRRDYGVGWPQAFESSINLPGPAVKQPAQHFSSGTSKMSKQSGTRYSSFSLKDIVCLCAGPSDDEAWEELVLRVNRAISLTIMRTASLWGEPSQSVVEDLVQSTYVKLWEDGCRLLRDFAIQHPEAILGYLKKIATNLAHDYFKHRHNQSSGGDKPHVSTADVDPEAGRKVHGSQESIAHGVLLNEIDQHLKRGLTGPDQERDRMIFWLYFRQGMSTKEIASLPSIGLGTKGVGSVIERLKHCIREQILGSPPSSEDNGGVAKSNFQQNIVIGLYESSEYETSVG